MTTIDLVVAYHEAGHAVAALHRGWWVRAVTLSPGGAGCCELSSTWDEDMQTDPIGFLIHLFAGAAAEKRLTRRPSPRDAQDRESASAIASLLVHDGADAQDPRVQATLRTCAVIADGLMSDPTIWRDVETIAAALRRRRRLTGDDVRQLLRREAQR